MVLQGFAEAAEHRESSPVGVALLGERGTGKTHLLGSVREEVQARDGYFFLISLLDASAFWRSTALSIVEGLTRTPEDQPSQLTVFLRRLADQSGAPRSVRRAVVGDTSLSRASLDAFVDQVRKLNRQVGVEAQDTARALVLHASDDPRAQDIGYEFLCSNDEVEPGERAGWGMRRGRRSAQEVVRDVSRLLALTGPTVMAVDQIDPLVTQSARSSESGDQPDWGGSLLLEHIAGGLMSLRETTRRTLSVVSCLPTVWGMVKSQATSTVQDRFREAVNLKQIPSADLGYELVAKRFAVEFAEVGFSAPHPTWPIAPAAFAEAVSMTPRQLLRTVDAHVRECLAEEKVDELSHLQRRDLGLLGKPVDRVPLPDDQLTIFNNRYDELVKAADPAQALTPATEDMVVPALVHAGLQAWIGARDEPEGTFGIDPPPGVKPPLHARLRRSLDESTDDEAHWAFRAISASHHIAVLNRIRNAQTAAGLVSGQRKRQLFLLRNAEWSKGARTKEVVEALEAAGGRRIEFPESDVRQLIGLRSLIDAFGYDKLSQWFRERRPADSIQFLQEAFAGSDEESAVPLVREATTPEPTTEPTGRVVLGSALDDGHPVGVDLAALRKHTAIFAGSGSGKTVLIRRLVEECALQGVSAIVLDPNNDLSRLGDPWPAAPPGWNAADTARSAEYLRSTEVVVWTPRRESGRPLSFQPLPDFAEMLDDADAFTAGIDGAVAALAPRAKVDGSTAKAQLGQAVLREALRGYARTGASDLRGFIGLLGALPEGMSQIPEAEKIGFGMAQLLTATAINDPLFGGGGEPVDPGLLLSPSPGHRARVSVISFVGLPDDTQRQSFVNQLQLALFAWIKRNPAGDRPLGGLLVMDEAQTLAPSGPMTACTHSTLVLASQARKYGLGLVFATQAPKGLHNRIPGNAATQFFGLLNHPTQITTARELARAKGSDVSDIARLKVGQFYAAIEGGEFVKMQAPWSLSYHPQSPPTAEEVLERARTG
ncbi:ATP-binding protein [Actinoplanes sp. NPDC004185]